jgi:acyl-lipid omega-6 desaturase (Delta-12 desaturase)
LGAEYYSQGREFTAVHNSKQILLASRPFAREQRWRSWWHLATTVLALAAAVVITCSDLPYFVRIPCSILQSLLIVRFFILFHDYEHGAILRGSKVASAIMFLYGLAALNPPSVWKRSHDHHHRHNSRNFGPNIGSFPLLTLETYASSNSWERFSYRASRHPMNMVLGYFTVFLLGMCLFPFLANPRRHFDAALSVAFHGWLLWMLSGQIDNLILAGILPFALSMSLGSYLFYAQHNAPGIRLHVDREWDHVLAATESSSYIQMGAVLGWFTGNIGFHHVHHLNAKIPFYRLPEAMKAIPALNSSVRTSLWPSDLIACFRLKLWDPVHKKLVPFPVVPAVAVRHALREEQLIKELEAAELSSLDGSTVDEPTGDEPTILPISDSVKRVA